VNRDRADLVADVQAVDSDGSAHGLAVLRKPCWSLRSTGFAGCLDPGQAPRPGATGNRRGL